MQPHQLRYQHQREEEYGAGRAQGMPKLALLLREILIYISFADTSLLESIASELTSSVGPQVPALLCYKGC